jgi:hypothetical protein
LAALGANTACQQPRRKKFLRTRTLQSEFAARICFYLRRVIQGGAVNHLTEVGKRAKICFHERQGYGSSDSRRIGTMTHPIKATITVGEPNWTPLELLLPACELENFMYMGRAGEIELYKHQLTRRYLNISADGQRFYRYSDGTYVEVTKAVALDHVRNRDH